MRMHIYVFVRCYVICYQLIFGRVCKLRKATIHHVRHSRRNDPTAGRIFSLKYLL